MNVFDMESSIRKRFEFLDKSIPDDRVIRQMLLESDIEVFNAVGGITHPEYGKNSLVSLETQINTTTNYVSILHDFGRVLLDRVSIYRTGVSEDWELVPIYESGYIVPVGLEPTEQIYGIYAGNRITFPNIAYMDDGATSVLVKIQYEAQFNRFVYIDGITCADSGAKFTTPDGVQYPIYAVGAPTGFIFRENLIGGLFRQILGAGVSGAVDSNVMYSTIGTATFAVDYNLITSPRANKKLTVNVPAFSQVPTAGQIRSFITKISVSEQYKLAMIDWVEWRYGKSTEAKEGFMRKVQKELSIGAWQNRSGISLSSAFDNNYIVSDYL